MCIVIGRHFDILYQEPGSVVSYKLKPLQPLFFVRTDDCQQTHKKTFSIRRIIKTDEAPDHFLSIIYQKKASGGPEESLILKVNRSNFA